MADENESNAEPAGDAEGYELAYREGLRWYDDQRTRLEGLRARIGTLFAAANIVGGFLIAQIFSKDRTHHLTDAGHRGIGAAIGALAIMCLALVVIWAPWNMTVNNDPRTIISGYIEAPTPRSASTTKRDLAIWMGIHASKNNKTLRRLQRLFQFAAIAFLIGIGGLGVALWDVLT